MAPHRPRLYTFKNCSFQRMCMCMSSRSIDRSINQSINQSRATSIASLPITSGLRELNHSGHTRCAFVSAAPDDASSKWWFKMALVLFRCLQGAHANSGWSPLLFQMQDDAVIGSQSIKSSVKSDLEIFILNTYLAIYFRSGSQDRKQLYGKCWGGCT
jgi:hypothetical protein